MNEKRVETPSGTANEQELSVEQFSEHQVKLYYDLINRKASHDVVKATPIDEEEVNAIIELYARTCRNRAGIEQRVQGLRDMLLGYSPTEIADKEGIVDPDERKQFIHALGQLRINSAVVIARRLAHPEALAYDPPAPKTPEPERGEPGSIDAMLGRLTERQAEVISMRYDERGRTQMSQHAIAAALRVTQSSIRDIERNVWRKYPELRPSATPAHEYRKPGDRVIYRVGSVIAHLTPRQAEIMGLRYDSDGNEVMTKAEVGDALGITEDRVKFVEDKILQSFPKLKNVLQYRDKNIQGKPATKPAQPPKDTDYTLTYKGTAFDEATRQAELAELYSVTPELDEDPEVK